MESTVAEGYGTPGANTPRRGEVPTPGTEAAWWSVRGGGGQERLCRVVRTAMRAARPTAPATAAPTSHGEVSAPGPGGAVGAAVGLATSKVCSHRSGAPGARWKPSRARAVTTTLPAAGRRPEATGSPSSR